MFSKNLILISRERERERELSDSRRKRGFTLIELLVVISIIGFLATLALVSLNSARMKARDARRLADLNQFKIALELFYDKNNRMPADSCADDGSYSSSGGSCGGTTGDWHANSGLRELVSDNFMSSLSRDPINNNTYQYKYEPESTSACLWTYLEQTAEYVGVTAGEPVNYDWSPFIQPPIGYQCALNRSF